MKFNFFNKPQINHDYSEIKEEVVREFLRQAQNSHNLACGVIVASVLITLGSLGLRYFNQVPQATLTSSSGIVASITSIKIAKQSKEELQEIMDKFYHK